MRRRTLFNKSGSAYQGRREQAGLSLAELVSKTIMHRKQMTANFKAQQKPHKCWTWKSHFSLKFAEIEIKTYMRPFGSSCVPRNMNDGVLWQSVLTPFFQGAFILGFILQASSSMVLPSVYLNVHQGLFCKQKLGEGSLKGERTFCFAVNGLLLLCFVKNKQSRSIIVTNQEKKSTTYIFFCFSSHCFVLEKMYFSSATNLIDTLYTKKQNGMFVYLFK